MQINLNVERLWVNESCIESVIHWIDSVRLTARLTVKNKATLLSAKNELENILEYLKDIDPTKEAQKVEFN